MINNFWSWLTKKIVNKEDLPITKELSGALVEMKSSINNIIELQSKMLNLFNNNNFYDIAGKSITAPMIIFDKNLDIKMCSQIDYLTYFGIKKYEHQNLSEIFESKNIEMIKKIILKSIDDKLHKSFFSIENKGNRYFISLTPLSPNGIIEYFNITVYNHNNIFSNQIMVVNFEDQTDFIPTDFASIIFNEKNICIYADGLLLNEIGIQAKDIIKKDVSTLFKGENNGVLVEKFKNSINGKTEAFTINYKNSVYLCRSSQLLSSDNKTYGTLLIKKI